MTTTELQPLTTTPQSPAAQPGDVARFLGVSAGFTLGLVVCIALVDAFLGWRIERKNGIGLFGPEVYSAVRTSQIKSDAPRVLILGDSVARQLFPPGIARGTDARLLTTNQAISMAGQYYLLENCVNHWPNLEEVYLLYTPGCFSNNLPPALTRDYFCGNFHRPAQIAEIFRLKKDFELTAAHIGRLLMPNLMAVNSSWRPAMSGLAPPPAPVAPGGVAPPEAEPILSLLTRSIRREADPPAQPAWTYGPSLSPISQHFLDKARVLCAARSIRLHVLPGPLSSAYAYEDAQGIYEMPPMRVDPSLLQDPVHFHEKHIKAMRAAAIAYYRLPISGAN